MDATRGLGIANAVYVGSVCVAAAATIFVWFFANRVSTQKDAEIRAATERIEQVRKENLELQLTVERERAARLELEQAIAPRHLTPEQKETFRLSLLKHATKSPVRIMVFIGTEDGIPFSLDIVDAMKAAGWNAEHAGQGTMGGQLRGVSLLVRDGKNPLPHAVFLQQAFKEIGIDAPAVIDPSQAQDQVTVFISPKR